MKISKLLTGQDLPLTYMEWVLLNTFALARQKLDKQKGKRR